MTFASTGSSPKPVLDEDSFRQLLAAAYVVQQHIDQVRAQNRGSEPGQTVPAPAASDPIEAELTGLQSLAGAASDFTASAKLITDRVLKIAGAIGVSISLVRDGYLDCVAESGEPAGVPGSSLASHSLVATERLKAGNIFDSADASTDIRLNSDLCAQAGVGSLVAAPLHRFGELAGLIEIRWTEANGFREERFSIYERVADLATTMLERQAAPEARLAIAAKEPASFRQPEPIAKAKSLGERDIKAAAPGVRIVEAVQAESSKEPQDLPIAVTPTAVAQAPAPAQRCRVCGQPFGANEAFCGFCSMPHVATAPADNLQSKWASLWFLNRAKSTLPSEAAPVVAENSVTASEPSPQAASTSVLTRPASPPGEHLSYFEPTPVERGLADDSEFFDSDEPRFAALKNLPRQLRVKDVALALCAVVLALGVVSAWPSSSRQTWFQSAAVRLGLAKAPAHVPNPSITVWIDADTSLYYCPGSDLYGKTPDGHYATEADAQASQIQPASGLACE